MANPIIAEVTRGAIIESRHRGAYAVVNHTGEVVSSAGNVAAAFFPRSAIKAFQCLPLIESGATARYGLNDEEIALCCSSHSGEADHLRVARSVLAKANVEENYYDCGPHNPISTEATYELVRQGNQPQQVHNPCSGKHAGMLATAKHLGAPLQGYVDINHPVQRAVVATLSRYCDVDVGAVPYGIDGCTLPSWALPLYKVALGFAKLGSSHDAAPQWIIKAVRAHPFMIAGTKRFDTRVMQAVPRLFIKLGAEGVFCGCIPHAGLGFALKCDDGTIRGAEVATALALSNIDVWTPEEQISLREFARDSVTNANKMAVGELRAIAVS